MCISDQAIQAVLPIGARDHILGSPAAQIILIEYGDFQSPQSKHVYMAVKTLMEQFEGQICYVFRHHPRVETSPRAQIIAEVVEAADAQGQFWPMYDLLLLHQGPLEDADLLEYAIALQLDIPKFLQDLADRVHAARILQDIAGAQSQGVTLSPTCFIGFWEQGTDTLIQVVNHVAKTF